MSLRYLVTASATAAVYGSLAVTKSLCDTVLGSYQEISLADAQDMAIAHMIRAHAHSRQMSHADMLHRVVKALHQIEEVLPTDVVLRELRS